MGISSPYWTLSADELAKALGSQSRGLTSRIAEERLAKYGENRVRATQQASPVRLLLRQYESPLVLILLFGAGISLVLRDWADAIIILLIVIGSTVLGFSQEYRASEAVRRLRARLALKVRVLRDDQVITLDASKLVPGDVIMLAAGNLVPGDGLVLEARDFLVTEAALTGESFPVEKTPGLVAADAPLAARRNAVFLGTSVRSGTAKVLVARTGEMTELAAIAKNIAAADQATDFERGVRRFGYLLTRIMMAIVLFVFTVNMMQHRPLIDSLLFAVALAVGLTPELLPAIVSVTLSAGAQRMARRGVLVRRLTAIENLGAIDVLCTDKTGTLTKGIVELDGALDPSGANSTEVMRLAAINARLETGIENPLDAAIVERADRLQIALRDLKKIDEIPYDFVRKRLTIVVAETGESAEHLIVTKGAFDTVLACCDRIACGEAERPLVDDDLERLQRFNSEKGNDGFRVLGLCTRRLTAKPHYDRADETGMVFEGFLLFLDPLKENIGATIAELRRLGIATKIISGDNRHVAEHVGRAIGLDASCLLTGQQLNATRDEALWHLAEVTEIFAEIDPQQKERIVRALQHRGHAVAYMGDGINDAPALHAADVGVSVDQAVDVARETADIVLLERDLDVLTDGVIDGRRTFANTLKYVAITTSANFGNMISMAIATLFVPFLPLLAKQILLNNFLSDFPSVAISTDNVDAAMTESAQRWDIDRIRSFMLVFGLISTAFDLVTFFVLLHVFHAQEALFQSTWFIVSLLTELAVVLVLRTRLPCWKSRPGTLLWSSTAAVAIVAIALPYMGSVSAVFGFMPLPPHLLGIGLAIVAAYICATELAKRRFYRASDPEAIRAANI
ncbi:MAG: magnesium-translocating P-type ATPase [Hyphomicrobiaceae bacterium]